VVMSSWPHFFTLPLDSITIRGIFFAGMKLK
jgi:hypothetical protein